MAWVHRVSQDTSLLLRGGSVLVVLFQIAYMAEDLITSPATFSATRDLHLLNILIGLITFAATFTALMPKYWRELSVALCGGLMISTTRIGFESANFELLFISIVALTIGAGTLAPWEGGWQAAIGWIGIACFYALEVGRPGRDSHALMHWTGLLMVMLVAQVATWMQKGYRRQIAEKIGALEAQHGELRRQIAISETLAAQREETLLRLAEREATMRQIFDSSLDVIAVTRFSDGTYLRVNEQFARVMGFTPEEALGVRAFELGVWIDQEQRAEFRRRLESDGSVRNLEMDFKLRDGRVLPFLLNGVLIEVDGERCALTTCRDISDIRENQRRLLESEEKFRRIFEKSADMVVVSNLETGIILEVNDQFVNRSGVSRERVVGRSDLDFGFFPDREVRDAFVRQLREEGFVQNREMQVQGVGFGGPVAALLSAVQVTLGGQHCGITVVRTIADLKLAERKLRESEATLRKILESSPDAVCIHDKRGRYVHVNQEFVRLIGYSREECIGKTFRELGIWPDRRAAEQFGVEVLTSGEARNAHAVFRTKDGRLVPSLISGVMLELDGQECCMTISRDISDLRAAELKIQQSEQSLRTIFESGIDPMAIIDMTTGLWTDVNPAFCRFHGLSREQSVGRSDLDTGVWAEMAEREAFLKELGQGVVRNMEVIMRTQEGRNVPCLMSAAVVELHGRPCCVATTRDISDRLEAESSLRKSQAALRKILDSIADPLTVTDMQGVYLDVNDAFVNVTGYSREELIGKAVWDMPLRKWHEADNSLLVELMNKGTVRNAEATMRTKAGNEIPVLISTVLIELNGRQCGLTIARDISERKQQELKLQQSEQYYRTLIESSSDVLLVINAAGNIVFVGGAGRGELGYKPNDVVGTSGAILVHPDDLMRHAENTRDAFLNPGKVFRSEARIKAADGRWVEFEFMGSATTDPHGNRIMITTMRNIAERKRAERELANARDQALAASKAKSEFLSSMSHEIRTPMNAILGMADLMSETELSTDQRRCLDTVISNGTALLELINSILDLAKVESGRLSLEKVEFDVVELTEKVADTLAVRAHGKGLELALRFAPNLPSALIGDPLRIRQVLINLIGNAIKFTEQGEVLIEVARNTDPSIPGNLKFSVRDSGIGIEPDKLATIFSAFTQADSSTTRRYGGSGLGLAIVERLVTLMGGYVRAESTPGHGSLFFFTVELKLAETSALAIRSLSHPKLKGMPVLLMDDNAVHRAVAREFLEAEGATVSETDSGAAGIAKFNEALAAQSPFGLLVVDSQMPGINGLETLECIGRHSPSNTPVLLMVDATGLTGKLAALKGLGKMDYIVKPLKQREFNAKVGEVIASGSLLQPATAEQPANRPASVDNRIAMRPLHLLLADDSPDNRMLIRAYLKKTPYSLDEAENGRLAYERFIEKKYDVVLMDIQMPVLDGYTAVRMMRDWEKDHDHHRTPIIALTASALDDAVRRARDAGCDMHVSKPVKKATLLEAIVNSIESAEAVVS